jgi:hypothetical protein
MHGSSETGVPERARRARVGRAGGRAHRMSQRQRAGVVLAMLAGAAMLVAACGGGSGSTSASGSGSGSGSQNNPAQFAQCMRSHGVPSFPDPDSSGHFSLEITKGGSLQPNSPAFQSAVQACHKYDTSFGSSQGSGSVSSSSALKFAKCMRTHGVTNFPDPQGGGRFVMPGSVQSNPHFQPAMQACRPILSGGGL